MNSDQKAILGFLLGATVGALAGLLLAPDTGTETRKKITDATKGFQDDLSGQLNTAINRLSGYVDKAKGSAKVGLADAEEAVKSQMN